MSSHTFLRDNMQADAVYEIRNFIKSIDESLRILAKRPTWEEEHPRFDDASE